MMKVDVVVFGYNMMAEIFLHHGNVFMVKTYQSK